jgi:SAM-dependent methyltransferase
MRSVIGGFSRGAWRLTTFGMKTADHLVRYSMYKALESEPRVHIAKGPVLSISHSTELARRLGAPENEIVEANYPDNKIDQLNFADNTFEAVVSDQVFEHIECSPADAVQEVYRVLKPGGLAIHTTCFLTPYHGSGVLKDIANGDFWRFTPSGLARLHKDYNEIIVADGWGNALMPLLGGLGLIHMPVPEARWHPLNKLARMNRSSYAYVVWVVARK